MHTPTSIFLAKVLFLCTAMISPFNKFRSSSGPDNERNVARLHGHSFIAQLASRKALFIMTVWSSRRFSKATSYSQSKFCQHDSAYTVLRMF